MIERRSRPVRRTVAAFASRRQSESDVVHRSLRIVVVRLMAAHANRIGQVVIVVDVALCAFRVGEHVEPRQRPPSRGVVEARSTPNVLVVAPFAGRWLAHHRVVRTGRVFVVRRVTVVASHGCQLVVVVLVASDAVQLGVGAYDLKPRQGVVERRWLPGHSRVASLAGLR